MELSQRAWLPPSGRLRNSLIGCLPRLMLLRLTPSPEWRNRRPISFRVSPWGGEPLSRRIARFPASRPTRRGAWPKGWLRQNWVLWRFRVPAMRNSESSTTSRPFSLEPASCPKRLKANQKGRDVFQGADIRGGDRRNSPVSKSYRNRGWRAYWMAGVPGHQGSAVRAQQGGRDDLEAGRAWIRELKNWSGPRVTWSDCRRTGSIRS